MYLSLNGVIVPNDSDVLVTNITEGGTDMAGQDDGGLLCHTDRSDCCRSVDGRAQGQWYFPTGDPGVQVPTEGTQTAAKPDGDFFFRNRDDGIVRLNRRGTPSERGRFRCEIPNADGDMVNLFVNIGE